MGIFDNEINNITGYKAPKPNKVENDAINELTNNTNLYDEISEQAPSATTLADDGVKSGFDWQKFGQNTLNNLSFGGGSSSNTQTPSYSFNPQNMQIQNAQMIQPIQNQGLANIGNQNLYNYLRG